MPYKLNRKIRDLTPYEPITGEYPIRLDANESFLMPPADLLAEASRAAAEIAYNRYPDPLATELCGCFAAYYGLDPALVTAGNGSDELISILCGAFLTRGERALVTAPDFSMYAFYAALAEADPLICQKPASNQIEPDALIRLACENHIRMILFSNPCNPTALGLDREAVRKIVRAVDALVVLDEAYMDFWDQSMLKEVCEYDNLIILRTCSKAFGMAAIRLGFAVANPTLTRAIRAVKSPYNVNSLTQAVGSAILRRRRDCDEALRRILASKRELLALLQTLEKDCPNALQVNDSHTNFLYVRFAHAEQVFHALLKRGIAVRFMGDYLRISAGNPEENRELCRNLREIIG